MTTEKPCITPDATDLTPSDRVFCKAAGFFRAVLSFVATESRFAARLRSALSSRFAYGSRCSIVVSCDFTHRLETPFDPLRSATLL
ncbi:hypothetical protein [Streptomyces mirabilis]|uniref:hypothetical protein n=1 Tax=Streptomyces mirabilis TaxID=68239 RepID=UPI003331D137